VHRQHDKHPKTQKKTQGKNNNCSGQLNGWQNKEHAESLKWATGWPRDVWPGAKYNGQEVAKVAGHLPGNQINGQGFCPPARQH